MSRTVIFDIWGPDGHFRKPYAPVSPVTFPFPPPTAVLGMVGAICGLQKDRYHEALGWERVRVGVRMLAPLSVQRAALNLLKTKVGDATDRYFRPKKDPYRIPTPFEFLRAPRFRIYLAQAPPAILDELAERLRTGTPVYTPSLGLANCLAQTRLHADGEAEALGAGRQEVGSVVPLADGVEVDYPADRPIQRFRVPAVMDSDRKVHCYQEVVVATDAGALPVSGAEVWGLGDERFCFLT